MFKKNNPKKDIIIIAKTSKNLSIRIEGKVTLILSPCSLFKKTLLTGSPIFPGVKLDRNRLGMKIFNARLKERFTPTFFSK
jgi:hypothetical protein